MLKQRIITALLLAPILLLIVILGGPHWFAFLVFVIQTAATYEWLKITKLTTTLAIINALVLALLTLYIFNRQLIPTDIWIWLFGGIWLLALFWLKNHQWGYQNTNTQLLLKSLLGVSAILLFALAMNQMYVSADGNWWTLALFFLIWVADIGAYVSGKTFGKHKLAIKISPGKTWEGVIGAQVWVIIYALVVSQLLHIDWLKTVLVMVVIALFSVVGDLAASLGKRQAQIKDSSNLLPGHGGFVDRFDSLIAAAPLYYYLLQYL